MLQFEQRIDDSDKPYIYLNTYNLSLDATPEIEIFKSFYVNTYELLKKTDDRKSWDMVFKPVNEFLNTLTDEEQIIFAKTYLSMHFDIMDKLSSFGRNSESEEDQLQFSENMDQLTETLSSLLWQLDQRLNISSRLLEYVKTSVPMIDFEDAGTSPRDSAAMTFHKSDVEIVTSLVIYCKLLTPIFGTIIQLCSKRVDNNYRVFHCVAIFKDLFRNKYTDVYHKLYNYIANSIDALMKDDISYAYNALTLQSLTLILMSVLIVRRFITVDIFTPDGNLMTYIVSCTRASVNTYSSNMAKKNIIKAKKDPDEIRGDEGNSSRLENESKNSKTTADIPIFITIATDRYIKQWIKENPEYEEMYYENFRYYFNNRLRVTDYNKYLISIFFGNYICGAASIEYLKFDKYVSLATILQIETLKLELFGLTHVITFDPSLTFKEEMSTADYKIKTTWNNSLEYKNCKTYFQHSCNDIDWDSGHKQFVESLTTTNFIYNTAPSIWDKMGLENKNKNYVVHSEFLFRDLYNLIRYIVNKEVDDDTAHCQITI